MKSVSEQDIIKEVERYRCGDISQAGLIINIKKIFREWLQQKLDELNKDDKRVYNIPTDHRAFMLEDLLKELGVEF